MAKKVYIIHRWWGNPTCDWIPWLKQKLEEKDFEVIVPEMPNPAAPSIAKWVRLVQDIAENPDANTYFVGHSVGCQTVLRYLQLVPEGCIVGGVVLVAPWIEKITNATEEEAPIARPWLETRIEWDKVKLHSKKFTVIYSDNDQYVPISEASILKNELDAKLVMDSGKGHFTHEEGVTQLPVLLEELLKLNE